MRMKEVSDRLDECYNELEEVKAMPESEVRKRYNAESKSEIIALIYEEITALESYQGEDCSEDDGMDYIGLQLSQGMAVIRW